MLARRTFFGAAGAAITGLLASKSFASAKKKKGITVGSRVKVKAHDQHYIGKDGSPGVIPGLEFEGHVLSVDNKCRLPASWLRDGRLNKDGTVSQFTSEYCMAVSVASFPRTPTWLYIMDGQWYHTFSDPCDVTFLED